MLNESIKQVGGARLTHPKNMKVGKTSETAVGGVSGELVPTRVLEIGQELFPLLQQNHTDYRLIPVFIHHKCTFTLFGSFDSCSLH